MAHFGKVMALLFAFAALAYCAPAKEESLSEEAGMFYWIVLTVLYS